MFQDVFSVDSKMLITSLIKYIRIYTNKSATTDNVSAPIKWRKIFQPQPLMSPKRATQNPGEHWELRLSACALNIDILNHLFLSPLLPDTFEMVSEDEEGKLMFKVNYHYMSQVKNASDTNSAARSRRLAQEAVTLSTSLPLSSSSSVFVRCDEERLDIMKVMYPFLTELKP